VAALRRRQASVTSSQRGLNTGIISDGSLIIDKRIERQVRPRIVEADAMRFSDPFEALSGAR
jgi:hypothetical protein